MLIRAALLEWVEWIINSPAYYKRPGIRRAFLFRIYYVMVKVRKIVVVLCLFIGWGVSCAKKDVRSDTGTMANTVTARDTATVGDTLTYLALGDSYTIGQSVSVNDRWPVQVVRRLRSDGVYYKTPDIIAVTGWTTGDLLNATPVTAPDPPYHAVSLLIGVNNQYQHRSQSEYRIQFTELLQRAIRLAGDKPSHVVVLSIPDYSVTPFARGRNTAYIAAQIDSFNVINKEIAVSYQTAYVDVTGESRKAAGDPSLIASDSLHFSGKEYDLWAEKMEPVIKAMH